MPKKITTQELLKRLEERNNNNPEQPVFLFPKNQTYINQTSPLQFKCKNGHIWKSTAERVIFNHRGCPHCKHEKQRELFRKPWDEVHNFFKQKYPEYAFLQETYKNFTSLLTAICPKHGKFTFIPINNENKKHICPKCKQTHSLTIRKEKFIERAKQIHGNYYDYSLINYKTTIKKVKIVCPEHGIFEQRPDDHLKGHGCPACVKGSVSKKQIFWLETIAKKENVFIQHAGNIGEFLIPNTKYKADGYCKETNTIYEFLGDAFHGNLQRYSPETLCHPFEKHLTAQHLYNQTTEKIQILKELGYHVVYIWESDFDKQYPDFNVQHTTHISKGKPLTYVNHNIPQSLLDLLKIQYIDKKPFEGYKSKHLFQCKLCGNTFETTITQRKQAYKKYSSIGCPDCSKSKLSVQQRFIKEISNVFEGKQENNVFIFANNTYGVTLIPLKENQRKSVVTLQETYKEKYGIFLFPIFEDEWKYNKSLVLSKLKHYSGQNKNIPIIHARKCEIKIPTKQEKSEFLTKYHIQGNDNSQIDYGAYYNNELVAIMTFTQPRVALGQKKQREYYTNIWELSRFATNTNYRVPGIASKLLRHFQNNHQWKEIFSYADKRWSTGNLYQQLGFTLTANNKPDYFYIVDGKRKHRWNFRKDVLKEKLQNFNPNETEYQNMVRHGYFRVWDSGTLKYVIIKI